MKIFGILLLVSLMWCQAVEAMPVVEVLQFRIPVAEQAEFLALDAAVWGEALAVQPGFQGRSLWRSPTEPDLIQINIVWDSRELWKAFPEEKLADLDQQMGHFAAALESVSEFEVVGS